MRYDQQIDWWIALIMIACVVMFLPLIPLVPQEERYILWLSLFVTALIILPFFYGYVELQEDRLLIRLGYIKQTIYYDDITSVRLSNNVLSSMAMTTKRIEINQQHKSLLWRKTYIGPKDREDVYDELLRRCQNLTP
jgi:hypothetical protein